MLKRIMAVSVFALVSGALAFGQQCQAAAQASAKEGSQSKSCSAACSGDKAEKCCMSGDALAKAGLKMPEMMYQVGDKKVCCPKEAGALANGDLKSVKYVVADKTYVTEAEATDAYGKALESFVADVTTVKFAVGDQCMACPMSAKDLAAKEGKKVQYRLASYNFDDAEVANKVAASAKDAASKVEMKMMVGDKCVSCPNEAAELAKKEGKSVQYVIGETKLECDKAAKIALTKARAQAAVATIAKAAEKKA